MLGEGIWKWGADIVAAIQSWELPILPFELVTYLGNETFYFILVPIFFWYVRPAVGVRLLGILLFSSFSNSFFKLWMTEPRPYWVSTEIKGHVFESSYGLPSGHSQNAVTIWGYLAYIFRSGGPLLWAGTLVLISLICFSRLVLGVHFPQDIIGGVALGIVALYVYIRSTDIVLGWFEEMDTIQKILYPFFISLALIIAAVILKSLLAHEDPESWQILATMAENVDGKDAESLKDAFDPRNLDTFISVAATLAGLGLALALSERSQHFHIPAKIMNIVLTAVIGFAGIAFFRIVPALLFDPESEFLAGVVRYVRYALIMLWAAYWGPSVFKMVGLARPLEKAEMSQFLASSPEKQP